MNHQTIIKVLDGIANIKDSNLTKLPVIPNTKGTYIAQYAINKGAYGRRGIIVYRVYPNHNVIGTYYLSPAQKNLKNLNSLNHKTEILSETQIFTKYLRDLGKTNKDSVMFRVFETNVYELVKRKENEGTFLEAFVSKQLGYNIKIKDINEKDQARRWYSYGEVITKDMADKALGTLTKYIENGKKFQLFEKIYLSF